MTSGARQSLLVVDDDERLRGRLVEAFDERGFDAHGVDGGEEALRVAGERAFDLAVVDLRMPGMGGLEVVRELKALHPRMNIVVLTGYGSIATALEAVRLGATHYVPKPADAEDLLAAFARAEGSPRPEVAPDTVPSLARTEWEHINRVLADCGGNISQAARLLGIPRKSLQRKLAKYPTPR